MGKNDPWFSDDNDWYDEIPPKYIGEQCKFAWLPKRCYLSKKIIWLTKAYKLTRVYFGPGDPIFEDRWHTKREHLMWKLKR